MDTGVKSINKIKEIIRDSGHQLHLQVIDLLRSCGWKVTISPFYNDPATGKARELDIIAEKIISVTSSLKKASDDLPLEESLRVQFFIECKYIKNPLVFWFDDKNIPETQVFARSNKVLETIQESVLNQVHAQERRRIHHYVKDTDVAKLHKTQGTQDNFFDGLSSVLNSWMIYNQIPKSNTVTFPIIILNSFNNVFRVDATNKNGFKKIVDSFQYEINYSCLKDSIQNSQFCLVDILEVDRMDAFIDFLGSNDFAIFSSVIKEKLDKKITESFGYRP